MTWFYEWLAQHPGGRFDHFRVLMARRQFPLHANFDKIPPGVDELLIVRGLVVHYQNCMETAQPGQVIHSGEVKYFVLSRHGLLVGYIGQTVSVIWRRGEANLIVEVD